MQLHQSHQVHEKSSKVLIFYCNVFKPLHRVGKFIQDLEEKSFVVCVDTNILIFTEKRLIWQSFFRPSSLYYLTIYLVFNVNNFCIYNISYLLNLFPFFNYMSVEEHSQVLLQYISYYFIAFVTSWDPVYFQSLSDGFGVTMPLIYISFLY